jgi:3-ketosteroid 9alpha-monooxygenase subunit B
VRSFEGCSFVAEHDDVLRRHGYQHLRVKDIVAETGDTRSFVLDVPADLAEDFDYLPGQFCTVRVRIGENEYARCYSMSSVPETEDDLTVTVKRVPGGVVSNWLNDNVAVGDVLEFTRPSGTFLLRDAERPVIGFCGGSGVTPLISIARSALAASRRDVSMLYANRDRDSVIFDASLTDLASRYRDRFDLRHHFDSDGGFVEAVAITDFVRGRLDSDFYICGPGPFMDLVEATLLGLGVAPEAISIERFVNAGHTDPPPEAGADDGQAPETIVLILRGKHNEVTYHAGDTVLETARRANLPAPYSCEAGSCATCMALVKEGGAIMRTNNALTADEVEEGWVLTCQAVPTGPAIVIEYEPL